MYHEGIFMAMVYLYNIRNVKPVIAVSNKLVISVKGDVKKRKMHISQYDYH